MADSAERNRRIETARALAGLFDAVADVRDTAQRDVITHDQIAGAVREICTTGQGRSPFSAAQIDCLVQIGFQLVVVLDRRNKSRRGFVARLLQGWSEARPIERIAVLVALTVGLPSAILGTIEIGRSAVALLP